MRAALRSNGLRTRSVLREARIPPGSTGQVLEPAKRCIISQTLEHIALGGTARQVSAAAITSSGAPRSFSAASMVDNDHLPGAGDAPKDAMAVVFTDIVKSTAIWEKDPEIMTTAMSIHDDLVRQLCTVHAGYEVKQNGDGFMIAFQAAIDALRFCLDVQTQLQEQEWPPELLEMGPGQTIVGDEEDTNVGSGAGSKVLWKGLRLRMSAHHGRPICKWNEVSGRMDYFGPVVNRAARFVGVCEGGQIVVSEDFLGQLENREDSQVGADGPLFEWEPAYETRLLGERNLQGIKEDQKLYFIVPKSLIGRLEYFPEKRYIQASKGNLTDDK